MELLNFILSFFIKKISDPLSLIGFIAIIIATTIVSLEVKRNKQLLKVIEKFPEKDRIDALKTEIGDVPIPSELTAEEWLKDRIASYNLTRSWIIAGSLIIIFGIFIWGYRNNESKPPNPATTTSTTIPSIVVAKNFIKGNIGGNNSQTINGASGENSVEGNVDGNNTQTINESSGGNSAKGNVGRDNIQTIINNISKESGISSEILKKILKETLESQTLKDSSGGSSVGGNVGRDSYQTTVHGIQITINKETSEQLESKLRELTEQYKSLQKEIEKLRHTNSGMMKKAKEAIDSGKFDEANAFINEAKSIHYEIKDGFIINKREKLMWIGFKSSYMIWKKAFDYVEKANEEKLKGYQGWRLPYKEELIDFDRFVKKHPKFFEDTDLPDGKCYWSRDDDGWEFKAWAVKSAESKMQLKDNSNAVRLVRNISE